MPKVIEVTERDGKPVLVMECVSGVPMKDLLFEQPDLVPELLAQSVKIQRSVHTLAAPSLRRMSERPRQQISSVSRLSDEQKSDVFAMLKELGDETLLCHGDLQVQNLMVDGDDIAIIDWMDATRGNPLLDACRTYVLYEEVNVGFAEAYLSAFCLQSGVDGGDVLRWAPVMRAARRSETNPEQQPLQ